MKDRDPHVFLGSSGSVLHVIMNKAYQSHKYILEVLSSIIFLHSSLHVPTLWSWPALKTPAQWMFKISFAQEENETELSVFTSLSEVYVNFIPPWWVRKLRPRDVKWLG